MVIDKSTVHKSDVLLFINGQPPKTLPNVAAYKKVYCTDGAYTYLTKNGVRPHVVSGDFDSVNVNEIDENVAVVYTPDQNLTDFEKAIFLIKNDGYKSVAVYGCSGLEQDHFLGNLHSMAKYKEVLDIKCFDDYGFYFFAPTQTLIKEHKEHIISLMPFPEAKEIESVGVKYPLYKEDLAITQRVGTRNTIVAEDASITFTFGNLLIFVQHKKNN